MPEDISAGSLGQVGLEARFRTGRPRAITENPEKLFPASQMSRGDVQKVVVELTMIL